MYIIIDET